jgi:hypothetical protein
MINEGVMFLASYGFYGSGFGNVLNNLTEIGFFDYVLPFLLIFSLVFGILSSIQIFKDNKGIDAIIALVVGLMALQFDIVPLFFAQVFPRLGVALAVILVILILAGFFVDPSKAWVMYVLMGIGFISAVVVLVNSAKQTGFYYSWYLNSDAMVVIGGFIFIIVVIAVVVGAWKRPSTDWALKPFRP